MWQAKGDGWFQFPLLLSSLNIYYVRGQAKRKHSIKKQRKKYCNNTQSYSWTTELNSVNWIQSAKISKCGNEMIMIYDKLLKLLGNIQISNNKYSLMFF